MHKTSVLLLSSLMAALGCGEGGTQPEDPLDVRAVPQSLRQDVGAVAEANNAFAFDLYRSLAGDESGNLFLSPFSISTALTMTLAGAEGVTEREMTQTLRHTLDRGSLHPAYGAMLASLDRGSELPGYELTIANRLWCQDGMDLLAAFLKITGEQYGAEPMHADFQQDPEAARVRINDWVEERTAGLIEDLFPPGAITNLTRLVLANAIHFKGRWDSPFDPEQTRPAMFWAEPERSVEVPMMYQKLDARIAQVDGASVLELPYAGEDLSMVFVVPGERDGLAAVESGIDAAVLETWLQALETRSNWEIYIPRFKITWDRMLNPALAELGMPSAFDPNTADFSGMTQEQKLMIQSVVHKAFVEVNEEGTEAAAATGVSVGVTSLPPSFRADRPFLFIIRDHVTGAILFLGRVVDPTA